MITRNSYQGQDSTILLSSPFYIEVKRNDEISVSSIDVWINDTKQVNDGVISRDTWRGAITLLPIQYGFAVFLIPPQSWLVGENTYSINWVEMGKPRTVGGSFMAVSEPTVDLVDKLWFNQDGVLCISTTTEKQVEVRFKSDYMLADYQNKRLYFKENYDQVDVR